MDLTALQQKINNYTTVISSWFTTVGKLYFDSTPQNVSVSLLDDNGNVTSKTFPNAAQFRKTVWDDVGGALGQFERKFYIDCINGADTNTGTANSPFATINKAIDTTPFGGKCTVYLMGSTDSLEPIEYVVEQNINIENKTLHLFRFNNTYTRILPSSFTDGIVNIVTGFRLYDGNLFIETGGGFITLGSVPKIDSNKSWSWSASGLVNCGGSINNVYIGGYPKNGSAIKIKDGESNLIAGFLRDGKLSQINLSLYEIGIDMDKSVQTNKLISLYSSAGLINFTKYNLSINALDGNGLSILDLFSGVIFDTNGLPRNINTNSVL